MKKIILLASTLFLFSHFIYSQQIKKDSCTCNYSIPLKYPDLPEEKQLFGTVIAEYEVDSFCVASNPRIIQSLGPDYDKEVLRVTNLLISTLNKCNLKCKYHHCEKIKKKLPIKFVDGND